MPKKRLEERIFANICKTQTSCCEQDLPSTEMFFGGVYF